MDKKKGNIIILIVGKVWNIHKCIKKTAKIVVKISF